MNDTPTPDKPDFRCTVDFDMYRRAITIASRDDTRYYLKGVHIEPCKGGGALLVATDGSALVCLHETDIAPRSVDWADDVARQRWRAFQGYVEQRADKEESLRPYLARTAEMSVRLATIMAMGRNKLKPSVSAEDVDWGCEVALWSATAMARACGLYISESQSQADTNRILRIVRDMGGRCTRAMVNRRLRGVLRKRDLDDTWKMIIEAGLLVSLGVVKADGQYGKEWFELKDE